MYPQHLPKRCLSDQEQKHCGNTQGLGADFLRGCGRSRKKKTVKAVNPDKDLDDRLYFLKNLSII
jgi:hypothetical protein